VERQRRVITFAETLATGGVALDVRAATAENALEKVAALLRGDPRVLDWDDVYSSLGKAVTCLVEDGAEFGVCIPHARTNAVTAMVMSAGRFDRGVLFQNCAHPIRYMFCIAVPVALASDYLRIVGLLARLLRNPATEAELFGTSTENEFVATLTRLEAQL
jgi:mannitol/fructose-specific phosphotransferase system IIA component (Ntr-type)